MSDISTTCGKKLCLLKIRLFNNLTAKVLQFRLLLSRGLP
jgi:hypothetical protein